MPLIMMVRLRHLFILFICLFYFFCFVGDPPLEICSVGTPVRGKPQAPRRSRRT